MSNRAKVVVLGGSGVATPELVDALIHCSNRETPMDLVLVGRSRDKLETVTAVGRLLAGQDPLLSLSCTTDAEAALAGADFVINQMRVGGLEARLFDETFPREIGLPGEETTGAGGFANAVRTVPVALEYARRVERLAPGALMLSFSNPASLVQYAVSRYTRVQTLGLCDVPVTLVGAIARALGVAASELVVDYVGQHHFSWVTGLWWRGRDLLSEAIGKAADIVGDIDPGIVQAMGAIPCPYFRYVFHPDRMLARTLGRRPRAQELIELQAEILADYERALATGQRPTVIARRGAIWYRAVIAPVLVALVEGRCGSRAVPLARYILNVVNGQAIPWLPQEAVVEVPTLLDGGQVRPLATGPVPSAVRALIEAHCAYEMLAAEAIVEGDRAKALRALLLNPFIQTYEQAVAILDRTWHDSDWVYPRIVGET